MNARSAFASSIYARWLAYSSMEWYTADYMNYTMKASQWDSCMNGQENCVISFGMYATSNASLAYYLRCLLLIRESSEIFYPGWRVRVYYDSSVLFSDLAVARSRGVETINIDNSDLTGKIAGMFWRFYVADDESVDRYIIRDLDSVFSWRERAAVDEWLISKRPFHILRDHFYHGIPMMGGMWGGTKGKLPFTIQEICLEYSNMAKAKGGDQDFLAKKVWPEVQKSGYVFLYNLFDAFLSFVPFSTCPLCLRYIAHSSNTYCDDPQRLPFPTRLRHPREFIGCPCEASEFPTLYQAPANFSLLFGDKDECPLECRPPGHPEWIYC